MARSEAPLPGAPQTDRPEPETPQAPDRRVAVLIVTRGQPAALRRCLGAISGAPFVIVVDNGSNDTLGLEEDFPAVRFIRLPRNFGMTKALNIGIRAAEAETVFFLSPTVEVSYATVLQLAETLGAEPGTGAVCPLLEDAQGRSTAQKGSLPTTREPDPAFDAGSHGDRPAAVTLDAILFRSFFLRALRQIDERYGDYGPAPELSQQVRRAGKTILIHSTATARITPADAESTAATEADREIGASRFLRKHVGFTAGVVYLLKRIANAVFTLRFPKAVALISHSKIDGT